MGMGIPHVCNTGVGDIEAIMLNTQSGYVVSQFNDLEYESVIGKMLTQVPDRQTIVQGAEAYYSLEKGVEKYLSVYKKVLGR